MERDHTTTQFQTAGALAKPGPIGRFVRFIFGVLLFAYLYALLVGWQYHLTTDFPADFGFFIGVAACFWVLPYVVNIGFTRNWRRKPQYFVLILTLLGIVWTLVHYGTIWGPPVSWITQIWLTYFALHLGISFVLSSLLATPGCEMRAIPHLIGSLTGNKSLEHHCPGVMTPIDRWELNRKSAP